jgi:hypothetical protein
MVVKKEMTAGAYCFSDGRSRELLTVVSNRRGRAFVVVDCVRKIGFAQALVTANT